jgi:flavin reductase (DIM6/NTAB) family NADH-FMN oxidoreductase RutF
MPAMATPEAESKRFRDVIGHFATGVTVITLRDDDQPVGITANAVSSLSLDPLLILFCVDKGASAHDALASAEGFAINLLALEQRDVSGFFATSGRGEDGDAMGGFSFREGTTGAPLLEGTLGWFDCRPWARYEGGDHTIVVGEVVDFQLSQPDGDPLLFFGGGYRELTPAG